METKTCSRCEAPLHEGTPHICATKTPVKPDANPIPSTSESSVPTVTRKVPEDSRLAKSKGKTVVKPGLKPDESRVPTVLNKPTDAPPADIQEMLKDPA